MSLLKLGPESDRLRRLAKAHAAGELATPEYRRMRSEVIDAFAAGSEPFFGEVTERRERVDLPLPVEPAAPAAAATRRSGLRVWHWALAAIVLVLAAWLGASRVAAVVPDRDGAGSRAGTVLQQIN